MRAGAAGEQRAERNGEAEECDDPAAGRDVQQQVAMRRQHHGSDPRQRRDDDRGIDALRRRRRRQGLAGVAEARAGHHRKRHRSGRARHPGMNARARRQFAEGGQRVQDEAERHEGITDMEDQQQPLTRGAIAGPACQPDQMQHADDCHQNTGDHVQRRDDPRDQRQRARSDHSAVKTSERHRQATGVELDQPVAGEARNDAAADQRDQQHHHTDAEADADIGRARVMGFEMEADIAGEQHEHQHHHRQIAPIAARDDLARRSGDDQRQEGGIDDQRERPADLGRQRHRSASGKPNHQQRAQRRALDRQPPGPVRDRREQKPGDDGRQEAIEHLVDVPVAGREGGAHGQLAVEHRQPSQDRQPRLNGGKQEKGRKLFANSGQPSKLRDRAPAVGNSCQFQTVT